jgi:hypothetical protein
MLPLSNTVAGRHRESRETGGVWDVRPAPTTRRQNRWAKNRAARLRDAATTPRMSPGRYKSLHDATVASKIQTEMR